MSEKTALLLLLGGHKVATEPGQGWQVEKGDADVEASPSLPNPRVSQLPYISRVLPTHSALTRHCESELADLSSDPNSLGKSFLTILYPSSEL